MKSLLLLKHIQVENANAIAGLTYGFPAITQFLGFTHALSRKLEQAYGLRLGGCAVIAHDYQLHAHQPGGRGDQVFALTRNPLTKEGKTAPFNEEGLMHIDLSLLIECEFHIEDIPLDEEHPEQAAARLEQWLEQQVPAQRLAGGTITALQAVRWFELRQDQERQRQQVRRTLMGLLPGFALVQRHEWLTAHHQERLASFPDAELLDSLLDFVALQYNCEQTEQDTVVWSLQPKPQTGYLVPITVGYQAISECYPPGEVRNSRDPGTPFCFVESVYTLGQWLSPHRVNSLDEILWRYRYQDGCYLADKVGQPPVSEIIDYDLY
ncbi:type I-F CRISPR-associated protein Csy2 [Zobellella denitrificans]